jgi:serine O-acetyltransferase
VSLREISPYRSVRPFQRPADSQLARHKFGVRSAITRLLRSDYAPAERTETNRTPENAKATFEAQTEESVSADIADWSREKPQQFWDPSRKLLLAIRHYQYWRAKKGILPTCLRKWAVLRYRFWSFITGSDIAPQCKIGGGLLLPHPNGILIHPSAVIGVNCLIFQQVTIGARRGQCDVAVIEGHVDIGAGAKILGPVHIGAHATIEANAVVHSNVPSGAMAFGAPAKILRFQRN